MVPGGRRLYQGEKRKRDSQKLEQLQQTIRNNKVVRRNLEMKNRALAIRAVFASSHSPSVPRGSGISTGYLHNLDGVQRATARKRVSELARDVWAGRRSISKPVTGVMLSETCLFQLATINKLAEIARGTPQVGQCQPSVESKDVPFINVTLANIRSSVEWAIHNSNSGKIGRMPTATRAGIGALATALQWSEVRGLQLWQQS